VKTLYIIRHAESEANKSRVFASQLPIPLSAAGRQDAARIAGELKNLTGIDHIVSSPLLRAVQTAEALSAHCGPPVIRDPRLMEQHLGDFSGLTYDEVKLDPGYERNSLARWNWIPRGGGESYSMIADRVRDFFSELEDTCPGGSILIVTHAVVFRLIRGLLENSLPEYPVKFPNNGEIWRVEFNGLGQRHEIESIFLGNSRSFVHNP